MALLGGMMGAYAQPRFVSKGKIEFERKTNIHRLYYSEEEMGSWDETMKKLIPQFQIDYFDLIFTEKKSCINRAGKRPIRSKASFPHPPQKM